MKENKSKLIAIICMLTSALSFSIMQLCVKQTPKIPLFEKIFIRNIFSLIVSFIVIKKQKLSLLGNKLNQKLLFLRSLCGLIGVILFFYGTMFVKLSSAAMINKLSPSIVILLACIFLKENINKKIKISIILSLLGSLFIIKPTFNCSIYPYFILLASSILSAIAFTSIKALDNKEKPYTIVFHYSLCSVILSLPISIFYFNANNLKNYCYLLCVGCFAAIGQIALTFAFKFDKASNVSIYDYTNILFSTLLGYIFLYEIPDLFDMLGGIMIITSALIIYLNKNKTK